MVGNLLDVMVHLPHQNCDHRKWLVTARPLQEPWLTIFARQSSALEHTTAAEWVREPQQPLQGLSGASSSAMPPKR